MRPHQAAQLTAGRSAFPLSVASNLSEQPRALSPAVAGLVSRYVAGRDLGVSSL